MPLNKRTLRLAECARSTYGSQPVDEPAQHVGREAERLSEHERNVEQLSVNDAPCELLTERMRSK